MIHRNIISILKLEPNISLIIYPKTPINTEDIRGIAVELIILDGDISRYFFIKIK